MDKVRSNIRRCPLLKHTRKEYKYDKDGKVIAEHTIEELNDCYGPYCMAWREKTKTCSYFEQPTLPFLGEDLDDDTGTE